jgi:hypothetical protein
MALGGAPLLRRVLALFVLMVAVLVFAACSSGDSPTPDGVVEEATSISSGDLPIVEVHTRWASATASDLPTLTASSDAVFVGRVVRLKVQRDEPLVTGAGGSALPVDGKPSRQPGTFPISTFEVLVEQAVFGAYGASTVALIEQAGGIAERADGSRMRLALEDDEPLWPGQRYLFFVRQKDNGTLSAAPFARLLVTDHGLQAVAPWGDLGALRALSGKPVDGAADLVRAAGGR